MNGAMVRMLAIASCLLLSAFPTPSRAAEECLTKRCQSPTEVEAMRTEIAAQCDCAGVENAARYMRCVKRVVKAGVDAGTFPGTCKGAVTKCEAHLGCGRGLRPFRTVQQIFTESCSLPTCHSALGRQGGLVLETEDVSYSSLVSRPAKYAAAGTPSGGTLVVPGDPDASFLIQKLEGTAPGSRMPQVGEPLSKGSIKLIAKWIKRGALTTAAECPPSDSPQAKKGGKKTCNDRPLRTGNFIWKALEPLPAPESAGIQRYTPPKDVAPGTEWETCYAFKDINWLEEAAKLGYPPGALPVIKQQTYRMHPGSHHLLLYAYKGPYPERWADGYFDCFAGQCDSGNPEDCPPDTPDTIQIPIGGTQVAGTQYEVKYPEGVGIPVLDPKMVLIANLHYTNPFQPEQPIYGESWLNILFYRHDEFKAILDGIFAINGQDLFVEPFQTKTISRVWRPTGLLSGGNVDAAVFQLFGHMHKRGTEFKIDLIRDGHCSTNGRPCGRDDDCRPAGQTCVRGPSAEDSTIYYTTSWDNAPVVDYQAPYLRVNKDEGLRWTCTHVNGVDGDPTRPPKRCHEGCRACGWDPATNTCIFTEAVRRGFQQAPPRVYQLGEPMPIIFGELADDDMCNMFGYFITQDAANALP